MSTKQTNARGDKVWFQKTLRVASLAHLWKRFPRSSGDYKYKPLTTSTSFRILKLLPGDKHDPIKCRLYIVKQGNAPPYEAVSYAWGNPTDTSMIGCQGKTLRITWSLHDALRHFRDPGRVRLLWADAICIDQNNDEERGHQVQQMGSIYANAERVLVWLGLDNNSIFQNWPGGSFSDWVNETTIALVQELATTGHFSTSQFSPEDLGSDATYRWSQFAELLLRPWFQRLWVIQEVGIAKSALISIGNVQVEFTQLLRLIYRLGDKVLLRNKFELYVDPVFAFSIFPAQFERVVRHYYPGYVDFDFLDILHRSGQQQASDPKDYIYALLGHPSATLDGVTIIDPMYNKTASEVFYGVAAKLVEKTKHLRVLSAVAHREETDLEDEFPSWVPKWSRDGAGDIEGGLYDLPIPTLVESEKALHIHGFIFDIIDEFTETLEYEGNQFTSFIERKFVRGQAIQTVLRLGTQGARPAGEVLSDIGLIMTSGLHSGRGISERRLSQHKADFAAFRHHLITLSSQERSIETSDLAPEGITALRDAAKGGDIGMFLRDVRFCLNRKLFSTRNGMLGVGPPIVREGDLCCILFNARVPFILRQVGSQYRLVGEAYIQGVMKGEAMVDYVIGEKYQEQVFEIF